MQFDFTISAATCFWSTFTFLIRPATRGSFADDVPCAIGTTIATSASPSRSHGMSVRLIFPPWSTWPEPPIFILPEALSRTEEPVRLPCRRGLQPPDGVRLQARRVHHREPRARGLALVGRVHRRVEPDVRGVVRPLEQVALVR